MSGPLPLFTAVMAFVAFAAGAVLAATLRRLAAGRAPADAPQLACMAGATLLYALNALLQPGRRVGSLLIGGGLLLAVAAIVFAFRARPRR
jgi:3-phosphoglycerate kinase